MTGVDVRIVAGSPTAEEIGAIIAVLAPGGTALATAPAGSRRLGAPAHGRESGTPPAGPTEGSPAWARAARREAVGGRPAAAPQDLRRPT